MQTTVCCSRTQLVLFDEVSTLFGMELAINKTKIVCNHYSKAMELEARNEEYGGRVMEEAQHDTRGSRTRVESQTEDVSLFMPTIRVQEENIEVVPQFRYLGLANTDDGALGVEIQARICRMKQRFKEFEGRIFCNNECRECRSLSAWS